MRRLPSTPRSNILTPPRLRRKHRNKGERTPSSSRSRKPTAASPRTRSRRRPRRRSSRPFLHCGLVRLPLYCSCSRSLRVSSTNHWDWYRCPRFHRLRRSHLRGPLATLPPRLSNERNIRHIFEGTVILSESVETTSDRPLHGARELGTGSLVRTDVTWCLISSSHP